MACGSPRVAKLTANAMVTCTCAQIPYPWAPRVLLRTATKAIPLNAPRMLVIPTITKSLANLWYVGSNRNSPNADLVCRVLFMRSEYSYDGISIDLVFGSYECGTLMQIS